MQRNEIKRIFLGIGLLGAMGVTAWISCGHHQTASGVPSKLLTHSADLKVHAFEMLAPEAAANQFDQSIRALGRNVAFPEQRLLVAWISRRRPTQIGRRDWYWLVNDVMDVLCHQDQPLPEWTDVLIGLARDKSHDEVIRDYAIQHLVDWLEPIGPSEPFETTAAKRTEIVETFLSAAREVNQPLSGTAVQALHQVLLYRERITRERKIDANGGDISLKELRGVVTELAKSSNANLLARITAFQICALYGFAEVLPEARNLATAVKAPLSLRLSAIAVLGKIGNAVDEELLDSLQDRFNPRLIRAIKPAVMMIQQRADLDYPANTQQLTTRATPRAMQ